MLKRVELIELRRKISFTTFLRKQVAVVGVDLNKILGDQISETFYFLF